MGQYYKVINTTKRQVLAPWQYDNGAKLMEHSYIGNRFMNVTEKLLTSDWSGDQIVWAGDYADSGLYATEDEIDTLLEHLIDIDPKEEIEAPNLYEVATALYHNLCIDHKNNQTVGRFILNHTKKEFVDKYKCPQNKRGTIIHPLALLTASGNGRGGGDYRQESDYIGSWANDAISIENYHNDYTEIIPDFIEK